VLGGAYMWGALGISAGPGYAAVGPGAFPFAIGLGLAISGLGVVFTDIRGTGRAVPDTPADWRTLGAMIALLAAYIVAYEPLGFIPATIVMYALSARVLGGRRWGLNIAVAIVLSVVVYFVFHDLLQVDLPPGALWTR
jgi:putative tricarboxylic transport membrane protein